MSLYSKFCAWLSGWPETSHSNASHGRSKRDEDMMFAAEEQLRENKGKKPKGLNPKKRKKKSKK